MAANCSPSHGNQVNPSSDQKESRPLLQRISGVITGSLEDGFYRLGKIVGKRPWLVILVALLLSGACMTGLLKFQRESRAEELWIPHDAQALRDKAWVEENFPAKSGFASFIDQDDNVLTSTVLKKMLRIHQEIVNITITFEKETLSWEDICFKKGGICSLAGILELWSFDQEKIESLTDEQILQDINGRTDGR